MNITEFNQKSSTQNSRLYSGSIEPLDALYGPWDSINQFVCVAVGRESLPDDTIDKWIKTRQPGLTIGVIEDGKIVEYWNPVYGEGFVKKNSDIEKAIEDLEYTVAESLVDLNNRVDNLEDKVIDTGSILMDGEDEQDEGEFLEVMGVTVGGLKNGDKVKNNTTLEQLIRRILQKEIDVTITNPTVSLLGYPSNTYYEIGETVTGTLSHKYSDGKFTGAESAYKYELSSGCAEGTATYSPKKDYSVVIKEGDNSFSVSVAYGKSTKQPKTNIGNNSTKSIAAGSCSDTKKVTGAYKVWYGDLSYNSLSKSDTSSTIINAFEEKKCTQGFINTINNKTVKINDFTTVGSYYVFAPSNFNVSCVFNGTTASPPTLNEKIEYILPNNEKINYTLWVFLSQNVSYRDIKIYI